ncbi:MAG TPA: response regulator [Verrucomicrobiae bacterium]|nr:response regulator [Verrucomicrobiae bacterium]
MKIISSRGRILIADDDDAFCIATRSFFRAAGYECESAGDATLARQRMVDEEFDLLIADLNMPGNSGLELVQSIPELRAGLPVIILTGRPTLQSATRSVRLPVVAYLVKPPNPDELLTVAEQAITQYRVFRAIRVSRDRLEAWVRDVSQLEALMSRPRHSGETGSTEGFLNLTLSNLFAGLVELKQFTEAISQSESQRGILQGLTLYKALQETVTVLEKTKQSFKSKELGELRRKLEGLLQTAPVETPNS